MRSLIVTLPGSAFDIPADPISPIAGLFPDPVFPPMATRYSSVAFLRGMNSPEAAPIWIRSGSGPRPHRNTYRPVISMVRPATPTRYARFVPS